MLQDLQTRMIHAFGVAALLAAMASPAFAHAVLVSAEPAPDSEVTAPQVITLHFSEAFEPKFSRFTLTDTDGANVAINPVESKDPKIMAAKPVTALVPGLYTVSWNTLGHDTHKRNGSFSFTVK